MHLSAVFDESFRLSPNDPIVDIRSHPNPSADDASASVTVDSAPRSLTPSFPRYSSRCIATEAIKTHQWSHVDRNHASSPAETSQQPRQKLGVSTSRPHSVEMPSMKIPKRAAEPTPNDNSRFYVCLSSNDNTSQYTCCKYPTKVLNNLNALRKDSRFCDVDIIAGGTVFKAHRAILTASSPYFHAMFTGGLCEQEQRSVELHSVSPFVLEQLIEFVYSGEVLIDQSNVQELMVASDMLEISEVVSGCTQYLKKELHVTNAVGIFRFAEAHNFRELATAALDYIYMHFPKVCHEDEFYDLPKDQLTYFLTSENLRVDSEFQVFQAAIGWIEYDIVDRRKYVFEILNHVRLPLLNMALLERSISECSDSSLKVALKSVHNDLISKKGSLVPLYVQPRLCAKKNIYVIGGAQREHTNHRSWHRSSSESNFVSVPRFDTFTREWCKAASMSLARILPGVAALNGQIYVVGGEQESGMILANAERYDPQDDKWTDIASMVTPRCEFGLCALDGALYAVGGWVGEDIGDMIERYDPAADKWTVVARMAEPRFSMGVVSYDGLVYMVGGCTQHRRHVRDLLAYDPVEDQWYTKLAPMTHARSQMGVAILDGFLYVVGGTDRCNGVLNSVERYSFKQNKWYTMPSMMVGRSVPAVAAVDGLLYVIGGDQTHDVDFYRAQFTLNSVECFDPVTGVWRECPPLPESRAEAGAVVL